MCLKNTKKFLFLCIEGVENYLNSENYVRTYEFFNIFRKGVVLFM